MQNISESTSSLLLLLFLFCLIVFACFFCCCIAVLSVSSSCFFCSPSFIQWLAERAQFLSFIHSSIVRFNKPFSSTPLFVVCLNQNCCIHPLHFHNFQHLSDLFTQIFVSEVKSYSQSAPTESFSTTPSQQACT